jgi:putative FmdB family regulatory protein
MPLYDYKCECTLEREIVHRITERPDVICVCGKKMEKQLSASVIKFNCTMPTPQKERR